jgi:DUF917 family protein
MRELHAEQLEDIARGAAILGTGGGGDPYLGKLAVLRAIEQFGAPKVIEPHEIEDDVLVALPGVLGATLPLIEKFTFGAEMAAAFHALERVVPGPIGAVMSREAGGVNSLVPLALGSRLGLPVVDADAKGRAYPEVDMVTMTLHGIPASPFALADEHGNAIVIEAVDNAWVERISRTTCVEFGAICASIGFTMTGRQLRESAIHGTLRQAEEIGRAIREAQDAGEDPIAAITHATDGFVLFGGKIVDVDRRTMHGWSIGSATVAGLDEFAGSTMEVSFQNENLVARLDGEVRAAVPDLITVIDSDSGEAITTERLRYGYRVVVLAIPCDPQWRTPAGVALGGPRHFRYDFDWVPVEQLNERPAGTPGAAALNP